MWLVFDLGEGQSFIAEFAGTDTVQDVRDLIASEFSFPDGFVLAIGSYCFSIATIQLNEIHQLRDMSVISVQGTTAWRVPSCASGPVFHPACRATDLPRLNPADSLIVPEAIHPAPVPPVGPLPPRLCPVSLGTSPTPLMGSTGNQRHGVVIPRVGVGVRVGTVRRK
jgi:hypothetical protein